MARILVVDDEPSMREFLEILLQREGHEVQSCGDAEQALLALEGDEFDLAISDIQMPGMSGLEFLNRAREIAPETLVVLITAHGTTESAVEAMKHGAYDYLTKPCSVDEIRLVVEKALEKQSLSHENTRLRRQVREQSALPTMMGTSGPIEQVFELVRRVAPARTSILITGESGTGKELVARAIHALSDRKDRSLVTVNCGAIPENLLESELFGHVKGAFTGAVSNKPGLFEVADGGTLFLDEIGEMPFPLQVKVLRALQDRTFRRVGGTSDVRVDVRILAATNRKLDEEVRSGRFREDLYYRLNVIEVKLPPLRERSDDVAALARHFIARFSRELGKEVTELAPDALRMLERHAFPGNVRELENVIERAVTLASCERITIECLPDSVLDGGGAGGFDGTLPAEGADLTALLAAYERSLLLAALRHTGGVKKKAAALLHVSFRSFRYRLEKLGLEEQDGNDDSEDQG